MKSVEVVTTSRADFGIYLPILEALEDAEEIDLRLLVSGTHLVPGRGMEIDEIREHGFTIEDTVDCLLAADAPGSISRSMGLATMGFAAALERWSPDLLFVLGDRFEMYPAAVAALPQKVPIAHIHGGEVTAGAIDDALRHSLTKLSHLHFVATGTYARRIQQLGEEDWRIHITGAPSLDNLGQLELVDLPSFERQFGFDISREFLLVTYHPVTLDYETTEWQVDELLDALDQVGLPVLFTLPNVDTSSSTIVEMVLEFADERSDVHAVEQLGTRGYFTAMSEATAMVGNSSSGLVEAPSFELPVVNIGRRQEGRVRGPNVVDVDHDAESISEGIREARSDSMRAELQATRNPYGEGDAAPRIVEAVRQAPDSEKLLDKRFVDFEDVASNM